MIAIAPKHAQTIDDLKEIEWDVIILGAGVAGAAAAILASKQGLKTLLVEAKSFPREKVCGGCLNLRSQASLDRLGVKRAIDSAGAIQIESMRLQILTTQARWRVPAMVSVRRSTLDTILVEQAVACGSNFMDRTWGLVLPDSSDPTLATRRVRLQQDAKVVSVSTKSILIACGLTRSSIRHEGNWPASIESDSRIGVQCLVPEAQATTFADGKLHMLVGHSGYVGICRTDGGLLDVAAAIDPSSIAQMGGIREVVQKILTECGHGEITLPEKEVSVNDTWEVASDRSTPVGPLKLETGYRLSGIDDREGKRLCQIEVAAMKKMKKALEEA